MDYCRSTMNRKITLLICVATVAFFSSCKTNPPNIIVAPVEYSRVFITANIDSAQIILDNVNTGKITPDTIEATVGNHSIRLDKTGYISSTLNVNVQKNVVAQLNFLMRSTALQKIVLLEDFANVSCDPCVLSNAIIKKLVEESYGHSKLVAIKFPTNFPSPTDPLYLANPAACNLRMAFYNIMLAPTIIIDGIGKPTATDSTSIKSFIDQRLQEVPKFYIEVSNMAVGGNLDIDISLEVYDTTGLDFDDLVLHTVVTESEIDFINPPGSNGETKFYDVMRVMLPSNDGESMLSYNEVRVYDIERNAAISSGWDANRLNTIVFVQNNMTKEILQCGSTF